MKKIDRILVGLELKKADLFLVQYVKELSNIIKPKKIDFIHISENLESTLTDIENFVPIDEKMEQLMRDEVSIYFKDDKIDIQFEVIEGKAVNKLLHWCSIKSSDLIVLGRKKDKKHAELTLEKIVRKAPCSVMIVPEGSSIKFNNFLFPVDYSDNTLGGIKFINQTFNKPNIQGIHCFDLPSGYYKTGKSEEEFISIMDNNSKKKAKKLISGLPNVSNLSFKNVCSERIDEFEYIVEFGKKNDSHIVTIRSNGKTNAAAVLLGSFAEKFIRHNRAIPTFVIKEKGENMDFLKAFLNL